MKIQKIFGLLALALLLLPQGCSGPMEIWDTEEKGTFTLKNESSYTLTNIKWQNNTLSASLIPGGTAAIAISADASGYVFFTKSGGVPMNLRSQGAVTVSQGKDTSFTITNSSVVVEVDNPGNSGALSAIAPILTTLTLKNMSFTDLQEVRWQGVSFAGNPLEDALTIGATVSQTVSPGYGYIYFKRKTNPAVVRSKEVITINTNEAKEFVFTDSTLIVETNNPDNMGTLKDMPTTVIFFDDAEGEVQGYAERRDSAYYAAKTDLPGYVASSSYNFYEPRAGSRSIAVGGSGDAKLQLNVTLNRAARLSFWYATKGDGTSHNAAFSIDGDPPENTWSGNINWSQVQYSLSAGSHQLIWTKIGHTTGNNYYYLSLDDILIVYTE